ncbi:MAG: proteasome subunit alpha, partial [Halanaeroarchaeum sp.]
ASAGHVADARQLIDFARRRAQVEELRYEEPIDVEALTKAVTDNIQQYTQVGGARPFGAALLIAGVSDGVPRLFETDPSGTSNEWKAVAIGSDRADTQSFLEDEWRDDLTLEEGIELGIRALAQLRDDGLEPSGVGIGTVSVEDPVYDELTADEIRDSLEELDLESADESADEDEST